MLKVGDFGLGAQTFGVIPDSHPVSERAAYGVNFSRVFRSTDAPRMDTYFNLLMMPETLNGTFAALALSEGATPCYRAYGVGSNKSIQWAKIYDELNKPTPGDIGAIPRDPIGTIVNNGTMASANSPGWWVVSVANPDTVADFPKYPNGNKLYGYGFMFVARSGDVWLQQYFSHHGANASRQTWNGDMSERTPWVIDYSTANPPPATDLSAYATQQWVLQNFVQNIDLTAPAEVGFWDGRGYPRGTDGAAMYNFNMVGGSSNVGNFIVRYTRKQVNNTWYVIN